MLFSYVSLYVICQKSSYNILFSDYQTIKYYSSFKSIYLLPKLTPFTPPYTKLTSDINAVQIYATATSSFSH